MNGSYHKGLPSGHFNGEHFYNQEDTTEKSFKDLFKWQMNRYQGYWQGTTGHEMEEVPAPPKRVDVGELRVTWVNHATVLLQFDGINVLTDPIWSERASPVSWAGPQRVRPPGLKFEDLPPIDIVVVSHNHYDHMDVPTLQQLWDNHHPRVLVPLGNAEYLAKQGIDGVVELDWWESMLVGDSAEVTLVPAKHFSMRGPDDRNRTLWGGWVLQSRGGPIYFAGDTGFGKHFKQIGERFGPLRLAILPIGAYLPRWFMREIHISPEEAVRAHFILKSQRSMGMHFGTFPLGDDGQYEPVRDLKQALKRWNLSPRMFMLLVPGRGVFIPPLEE